MKKYLILFALVLMTGCVNQKSMDVMTKEFCPTSEAGFAFCSELVGDGIITKNTVRTSTFAQYIDNTLFNSERKALKERYLKYLKSHKSDSPDTIRDTILVHDTITVIKEITKECDDW